MRAINVTGLLLARQRLWESPARRGEARGSSPSTKPRRRSGIRRSIIWPVRCGRLRPGDPQAVNVRAGNGFQKAKPAPVAEIVKSLT